RCWPRSGSRPVAWRSSARAASCDGGTRYPAPVLVLYPWIVFLHVIGAFAFVLAHGASALAAFRIRVERDPERIGLLLDLSRLGAALSYTGLLVLLVAGIAAGIAGHWFGTGWIWAAIGVLLAVMLGMYATATPYYNRVRVAVGKPAYGEAPVGPP